MEGLGRWRHALPVALLCAWAATPLPPQHGTSTAWGYVDIDLDKFELGDFVEWGRGPSGWGTYVARDAKVAVATAGGFGGRGSSSKTISKIPNKVKEERRKDGTSGYNEAKDERGESYKKEWR